MDHLTLTYIIKSKQETASAKIKRLLEVLSVYSVNLYYMKEKMTPSNFLSRMKADRSSPHETIPIFFDLQDLVQKILYSHKVWSTENKYYYNRNTWT